MITPAMGISSLRQMLAASSRRGTRSFSVAPNRLRATSTSPEQQSRSTHNTSCPTSGRPPIERQDHLLLVFDPLAQPFFVRQMQCEQFFIAIELIGHRALCHLEPSSQQFLMNLRDAALLLIAQRPHQRDHIQAKFPMRQRPSTFLFRARRLVEAGAGLIAAPIHFQGQLCDSG